MQVRVEGATRLHDFLHVSLPDIPQIGTNSPLTQRAGLAEQVPWVELLHTTGAHPVNDIHIVLPFTFPFKEDEPLPLD